MSQIVSAAEATRRTGLPHLGEDVDLSMHLNVPAPGAGALPEVRVLDRGVF